jgi:hypothetical protein
VVPHGKNSFEVGHRKTNGMMLPSGNHEQPGQMQGMWDTAWLICALKKLWSLLSIWKFKSPKGIDIISIHVCNNGEKLSGCEHGFHLPTNEGLSPYGFFQNQAPPSLPQAFPCPFDTRR